MRGRILQYNGNDGTGVIIADGQQYRFTIGSWRSETPPAVGKTVELEADAGEARSVSLVADDVLLREKTAELTGKLGQVMGGLGNRAGAMNVSGTGGSIVARYGVPLLAAFAVFVIATIAFNAITVQMFGMKDGKSLFDLSSAFGQMGGGGGGVKLLLILAYASIVAPFFWADKRAWLLLLLPLFSVLWGMWSIRSATSGAGPMSEMFSYGFGLYLALIASIVIAAMAVRRFRAA